MKKGGVSKLEENTKNGVNMRFFVFFGPRKGGDENPIFLGIFDKKQ